MNRRQIRKFSADLARVKPKQKQRFTKMLAEFKSKGLEACEAMVNDKMSSTDKSALQSAIIELKNEKLTTDTTN